MHVGVAWVLSKQVGAGDLGYMRRGQLLLQPPPAYVQKAFRKYLECGFFVHGFAWVRCDDCGDDFLVAFSCGPLPRCCKG